MARNTMGNAKANAESNDAVTLQSRAIRLRTLITLRWIAIAGQTAAVLAAHFLLGVQLPLMACLVAIGIGALLNLAAIRYAARAKRLGERETMLTLMFDLLQVSALLYLTGGLTNPFAMFLLAPVTISAAVLELRTTLALGAVSIAAASVLSLHHLPLRLATGETFAPPALYLIGFWLAIAISITFQSIYSRKIAEEAFNMAEALNAAQMALAREQRLSAIGALAAAAAHELGTPLATIKLAASELKSDLSDRPELAEDAALIADQAARCRRILERLAAARSPDDAQMRTAPLITVLEEAAGPHLNRRSEVIFRYAGAPMESAGKTGPLDALPAIQRRPEIIHGLRNLVQNGVDFAASTVWIDLDATDEELIVQIGDDGPGFSPEILSQLGEPFATTRGKASAARRDGYQGMGLGVFIAKTLLERTGADVRFANADPEVQRAAMAGRRGRDGLDQAHPPGAIVRVAWARDDPRIAPSAAAPEGADSFADAQSSVSADW